jgi:hypothetical protein
LLPAACPRRTVENSHRPFWDGPAGTARLVNRRSLWWDAVVDPLTFIAELVKALGWPLAVVALVLLLRQPLVKLIPKLRRVKYGGFEFDFGEKLEEAEEKADAARLPPAVVVPPSIPPATEQPALTSADARFLPFSSALALAEEAPRGAISESWRLIEGAIQRALRARNIDPDKMRFQKQVELLLRELLMSDEEASLLRDLRALRNVAVHYRGDDQGPTAAQAREFVLLSQRLVRALDERLQSLRPPRRSSQE